MVRYEDGGGHCFACGRHEFPSPWDQLTAGAREKDNLELPQVLDFPRDYTPLLEALWAKPAMQWIKAKGITDDEIRYNKMGWDHKRNLLIYPVYDQSNKLAMWQARNFNGEGQKYLTFGEKSGIMHLVGRPESSICIVTEDLISAIKVGRGYQAMPLWGADMALGLIKRVAARFSELGIWLDSNKTKEAVKIALRASQYIPTFVVTSMFDPKEYGVEIIRERVEAARNQTLWREHLENPAVPKQLAVEESCPSAPAVAKPSVTDAVGDPWALTDKTCPKCHLTVCQVISCPFGSTCALRIETKSAYVPYINCPGGNSCISPDGKECVACREWEAKNYPFPVDQEHSYAYKRDAGGS